MTPEIKTERLKTFDTVRATAAMMVFLFHAGYLLHFAEAGYNRFPSTGIINWTRAVWISGTVGVNLFFVLSGFLLFYQLYKKREPLSRDSIKQYVKKRLLRILPLFYFSTLAIIFIFRPNILTTDGGIQAAIYNLSLFIIFTVPAKIINPVSWTLIMEIHFYLALPIFYYFFHKRQRIFWFFVIIGFGLFYRAILVTLVDQTSRYTPANLDFFAFGMLGAYLYVTAPWIKNLGRHYIQLLLLLTFGFFVYMYDLDFKPTLAYVLAPTFFGLITTTCMLSFLANEQSLLARITNSRPILFIAKISFGIFLWHGVIIEQVQQLPISNLPKFYISLVFTLVLATITYYTIEAPFINRYKPKTVKSLQNI